jgi:hypothetical protein
MVVSVRFALLIAALLLGLCPASAQFSPSQFGQGGFSSVTPAATGCSDSNATAWKNAVITAGGTVSSAQLGYVCTLITALKTHGSWSTLDRLWLWNGENTFQDVIDLVNLAVATPVNSPTFVAAQGVSGDGSTSYINTNWYPAIGGNWANNGAQVTTYIRTNRTSSSPTMAQFGTHDAPSTGEATAFFAYQGGDWTYDINDAFFANQSTNTLGQAQGLWTMVRSGSASLSLLRNSNSTPVATGTTSSAGSTSTMTAFVGAVNEGSPVFFCTDQIAITAIGGVLTDTQIATFQTDLNAYMTSLGTNVY